LKRVIEGAMKESTYEDVYERSIEKIAKSPR